MKARWLILLWMLLWVLDASAQQRPAPPYKFPGADSAEKVHSNTRGVISAGTVVPFYFLVLVGEGVPFSHVKASDTGFIIKLTAASETSQSLIEEMRVSKVHGDTLFISQRGVENTSPQTWQAGAYVGVVFSGEYIGSLQRAINDLIPAVAGQSGKILSNNGGHTTWIAVPSISDTGTVTSVGLSGGSTGLVINGSPITSSGTMTIAGTLGVANGGLGHTGAPNGTLPFATSTNVYSMTSLGTGLSYSSGAINVSLSPFSTTNLPEGTNLYYTQPRFDAAFAAKTTDALPEGSTNLYYTDVRADARITLQKGASNGIASLDAGAKVPLSQLNTVDIAHGGTSATTKIQAEINLLPDTTNKSGDYLRYDGAHSPIFFWDTAGHGGGGSGVTSVDVSGGSTGLTTSGGPITSSGTITIAGTLVPANGGTGVASIPNHGAMIGAGTGNVTTVAPGASGNVFTSNGTSWTSAPPATNGTVTSVAISGPSIISWSGSPITSSGTLTGSLASQSGNLALMSPDGSTGTPNFRALVVADLPTSIPNANLQNSSITIQGSAVSLGGSTLATNSSPTFASETLTNATNQLVLGTTNTTTISAAAPAASAVYTIPDVGTSAHFVMDQGSQTIAGTKTFSTTIVGSITGNSGTVTNGVYTLTNQTIGGNKTFSGTTNLSGLAASGVLSLDASKNIASTALTNGQLLIGSTGSNPVAATISGGTGITVNNTAGGIQIVSTGGGSNTDGQTITGDGSVGAPITLNDGWSNIWTSHQTISLTDLETSLDVPGWYNINSVASTNSITVQNSPAYRLEAHGWSTHTTAADTVLDMDMVLEAISGAFASSKLHLRFGNDLLGFTDGFTLTSAGNAVFAGTVSASNLSGTNTGDQTITLTGDVTGSGTGSFGATIANLAVTNAKIANSTIDLTAKVTGLLPLANGGTNANLTASNGGIFYSTGSAGAILSGTATAGQILRSGSSAAPSWSTATYPATAGSANNVMTSDGTNWTSAAPPAPTFSGLTTNGVMYATSSSAIASTSAGTAGQVFTSNGSGSAPTYQTPTVGGEAIFGDGADGTVYFDGTTTPVAGATLSGSTYTMTRVIRATNVTVSPSVTVNSKNYPIFATGTFLDSGIVQAIGLNASGTTGGTSASGSVFIGPSNGGAGRSTAGNGTGAGIGSITSSTPRFGGMGGDGGIDGQGHTGGTAAGTGNTSSVNPLSFLLSASGSNGTSSVQSIVGGIAGSGGAFNTGTGSGAGGGAGGVIAIIAHIIKVVSGATISVNGGNGSAAAGSGNAGGGGGGGGGAIGLLSDTYSNSGSVTATHGTGGAAIGTGLSGVDGSDGTVYAISNSGAIATTAGTVTSVGLTAPSIFSVSGSPVTGSGTIAVTYSGTALPVANGGTGLTSAGSNGQSLTVVSSAPAWKGPNTFTGAPANPPGTSSATALMMGLGSVALFTPATSGTVEFLISGNLTSGATGNPQVQMYYGTGAAPANGAAVTGTLIGNVRKESGLASSTVPVSCIAVVTGLTVGTVYWFDISLKSDGTSTATITDTFVQAIENK